MDKWKESLAQRVKDEGEVLDPLVKKRIEEAIDIGAKWVAEQATVCPESTALCLEYISKHIARRTRLLISGKSPETEEALSILLFLSERLEKKGVDISNVSIEILEKMTAEGHKKSFRTSPSKKRK